MNAALIALLVVPVAAALIGALPGIRSRPEVPAILGAVASLVLAILLAVDVDTQTGRSGAEIIEPWIPQIGVQFHVAVDGLNAVLLVMTAFVWLLGTWWSSRDKELGTPTYFFLLGLAQTAVVGAFLAQDLLLFVLFFDLMLLPFVLIVARASDHEPGAASPFLQLLVYTLVGSLLMLVGTVALAIFSQEAAGAPITFDIAALAGTTLPPSTQKWLLVVFLAAFLIKMPIAPLHGWMPSVYRAMPLPALTVFAAVLSKVAAYGMLKIVLPLLPDAVVSWRLLLVVLALVSIIYGSMIAFTTQDPRLILGYSSLAQLGFILLGISSLDPAGAQGAVLQSVTHAVVVVPAVVIIALVMERSGGEGGELRDLGGIAKRAPVLAGLFLIVTLAWLAMPGTGNFVGEYLVLLGQWRVAPWATIVASIGIVLAAFYALRLMIGAMQNARGAAVEEDAPDVHGRDRAVLAVSVAAIVALALAPSVALRISETSTQSAITPPRLLWESEQKADGANRAPNEVFDPGVIR